MVSHKPSKQRRYAFAAPLHRRRSLLSAALSSDLRIKHMRRSFPVRKDDVVKILKGDYTGLEGKVTRVNLKKTRIIVEGVTREKADGKTVHIPIHPSKVIITRLNTDDKWRAERLAQTAKAEKTEAEEEEEEEQAEPDTSEEKA